MKKPKKQVSFTGPRPAAPKPAAAPLPRSGGAWLATLSLVGLGWAALAVCAVLWQLWSGSATIVYLSAVLIGVCFTLAVLFDHALRRGRRRGPANHLF